MTPLPFIDVLGFWIGIFLTLAILSFLYKDNPFYKLAEHLFVGTSIGYIVVQQYFNNIEKLLVKGLPDAEGWFLVSKLVAIVLILAMLTKAVSKRWAWVGRYPLAFVVALYAGLQINAVAQSELGAQIKRAGGDLTARKVDLNQAGPAQIGALPGFTPAMAATLVEERAQRPFTSVDDALTRPGLSADQRQLLDEQRGPLVGLDALTAVEPGRINWFGVFSNILLLLGTLTTLLYFYFSLAQKGLVGKASRFGVWVMMVGFGASFGFTVQGRIALAIGRAQDIRGTFIAKEDAAQIHGPLVAIISAAIIIAGLVVWERRQARAGGTGGPGGDAPPGGTTAPAAAK
ncbi:MAG: helix-hairpin-helix domain-containing protein [Kofleriaceae bacterium]|nr:helix-hairpin-helix domain-containing protein [Kofleriaceae bacterium]